MLIADWGRIASEERRKPFAMVHAIASLAQALHSNPSNLDRSAEGEPKKR